MRKATLLAFLTSLALVLLAIVDFRRGFLFDKSAYISKTPYYVFTPWHVALVALGLLGAFFFGRKLDRPDGRMANFTLLGIFALLLIDAGLYRGVAASRAIGAGAIGLDWLNAFGAGGFLKPLALSGSYVLTVWHATVLSCLGAGLAPLALPRLMRGLESRRGMAGSLAGTAYALTQPFCSCCVAMTSPGLFRKGNSMNFVTAVLLGSPLLNISTLFLAASLLPWPYAALRILGGVGITLALSFVISRWLEARSFETCDVDWKRETDTNVPITIVLNWLKFSGRVALFLIPSMIVGTILSALVWSLWPSGLGNSVYAVGLTAIVGSVVMVSTWSEIPLALQMIREGLSGPAATSLLALPAVNLGSLLIIGRVSHNWKMTAALGLGIMVCSLAVGVAFL